MQLLTSIYYDCRLLPHFLDHYRRLGVDRFLCVVNVNRRPSLLGEMATAGRCHDLHVATVLTSPFDVAEIYRQLDDLRRSQVDPDDWVLVADLDEFIEPPAPIPELIRRCERAGCDYVGGGLVDRLAADGTFPELRGGDIGRQFPLAAAITDRLLEQRCAKVPLMRATCPIEDGLHETVGRPLPDVTIPVYRFSWFAGVVERMRDRLRNQLLEGSPARHEAERFLDYYNRVGRIDVSDPAWDVRSA